MRAHRSAFKVIEDLSMAGGSSHTSYQTARPRVMETLAGPSRVTEDSSPPRWREFDLSLIPGARGRNP